MGNERARPFVIGVTGPIASGKSTVLRELKKLGAATIDADHVYHSLIRPGSTLFRDLVSNFGSDIVASGGQIDRKELGGIVFNDPDALRRLDALTHPAVSREIQRLIESSDVPVVAVDAVKLVESGFNKHCDEVWLVTCPVELRVDRLRTRNRMSREDAETRVRAHQGVQPVDPAINRVIDNSGDVSDTRRQVLEAWDAKARQHMLA